MINNKILALIFSIGILISAVVYNISSYESRQEVLGDNSFTYGWIVDYREMGEHDTRSLEYSYMVKGKLYSRSTTSSVGFNGYRKKIETSPCARMRFFVIYSISDPSKSLIDLKRGFDISEHPPFPDELGDFE